MSLTTFLEEMAVTAHHRVNIEKLLKEEQPEIRQAFANNDTSSLKTLFNDNTLLADRTTIFEL